MKRYFRLFELFDDEKVYFNAEFEPCDKKDAYLFSEVLDWMEEEEIEWCGEDENMRLNGQEELFKL